ncbi:serine protease inhibitor swm-1-like isoform X2 [Temnothorax nylanderi]
MTIAQRRCPRNQEWICGSACPPSCNSQPNQPCTLQCVEKCQCKDGLLLNSSGNCMTIAQRRCPRNQEWTTCGSACPPSCNSQPNQPCTLQCVIGCQCRQGFLLNSSGNCVHPSQCYRN